MDKSEKPIAKVFTDEDLGLIFQQLEDLEHFYPVYLSMIKK